MEILKEIYSELVKPNKNVHFKTHLIGLGLLMLMDFLLANGFVYSYHSFRWFPDKNIHNLIYLLSVILYLIRVIIAGSREDNVTQQIAVSIIDLISILLVIQIIYLLGDGWIAFTLIMLAYFISAYLGLNGCVSAILFLIVWAVFAYAMTNVYSLLSFESDSLFQSIFLCITGFITMRVLSDFKDYVFRSQE